MSTSAGSSTSATALGAGAASRVRPPATPAPAVVPSCARREPTGASSTAPTSERPASLGFTGPDEVRIGQRSATVPACPCCPWLLPIGCAAARTSLGLPDPGCAREGPGRNTGPTRVPTRAATGAPCTAADDRVLHLCVPTV